MVRVGRLLFIRSSCVRGHRCRLHPGAAVPVLLRVWCPGVDAALSSLGTSPGAEFLLIVRLPF